MLVGTWDSIDQLQDVFFNSMLVGIWDSIDQLQNVMGKKRVRFSDARIFFQLMCIIFCSHVCSNYFPIWCSPCFDFVGTCAVHFVAPGCMHCVLYLWKCSAQLLPLYLNGDPYIYIYIYIYIYTIYMYMYIQCNTMIRYVNRSKYIYI